MVRNSFTYDESPRETDREREAAERRERVNAEMREDDVPVGRRPSERAAYERLDARLQGLRARGGYR